MTLGLALALAPVACDDGGSKEAKPAAAKDKDKDKGKKAGAHAADAKGAADKTADAGKGGGADAAADEPKDEDVVAKLDERVQRAAKLARQIEAKPEDATNILEAADLDRAGFEELIYSIGTDPDLSKQYQLAMANG